MLVFSKKKWRSKSPSNLVNYFIIINLSAINAGGAPDMAKLKRVMLQHGLVPVMG
jgi:hypothetical protein